VLLLVLAERLDAAHEADLLRGGADGVISNQIDRDAFIQAVGNLLAGRSITSLAAMRELREARPAPVLPPRMRGVIELLAEGCGTAEIAERLSMSQGTVKTHIGRAAARLGLSGRNELVANARKILTEHPVS